MPDNHVLRVAHERGDAADVCAGRKRDQIRQQREFTAPDDRDYKRVSIRQIVSFMSSAERTPDVSVR